MQYTNLIDNHLKGEIEFHLREAEESARASWFSDIKYHLGMARESARSGGVEIFQINQITWDLYKKANEAWMKKVVSDYTESNVIEPRHLSRIETPGRE